MKVWHITCAVAAVLASTLMATDATHQTSCPICGYNAICDNGYCVCPADCIGDPLFLCYYPKLCHSCTLKCDPEATTYDNQNTTLQLITSSQFSKVITDVKLKTTTVKCTISVHPWPERIVGKLYPGGLDFSIRVSKYSVHWGRIIAHVHNDTQEIQEYVWQIQFKDSNNSFKEFAKLSNRGFKNCSRKTIGCWINFHICPLSNFLVVSFPACGQKFGIRPFNPYHPNIPGIWVKAPITAIYYPLPYAICNRPKGPSLGYLQQKFGFATTRQLVTYFTLKQYGNPYQYPHVPERMKDLRIKIRLCPSTRIAKFFKHGEPWFENAALIRCLGPNNLKGLLDAVLRVLAFFCHLVDIEVGLKKCNDLIADVKGQCPRYVYYPEFKGFLEGFCAALFSK